MKKYIFSLLILFSYNALSAPEEWTGSYHQGVSENILYGKKGTMLNLSCDTGGTNPGEFLISVSKDEPGGFSYRNDTHDITLVVSGNKFQVEAGDRLDELAGSLKIENLNTIVRLLDALKKNTTFDVYVDDKKVDRFLATEKSARERLPDSC